MKYNGPQLRKTIGFYGGEKTMQSKKLSGLHIIGETLDVDAYTGGFNLQIAWSTAYAVIQSGVSAKCFQ